MIGRAFAGIALLGLLAAWSPPTAAASDPPSAAGIPTTRGALPATQPARAFDGVEEAFKTVPAGVLPLRPEGWNVAKIDAANMAFHEQVVGQQMKVPITVGAITRSEDKAYDVAARDGFAATYSTSISARFPVIDVLEVAKLKFGDVVAVEGIVTDMRFIPNGDNAPILLLSLDKSHIGKLTKVVHRP